MCTYRYCLAVVLGVLPAAARADAEPDPAAELARLARQRRDAARRTYEVTWANYRDGRAPGDTLYRWSKRWLDAERRLSDRPADHVAACRAHWERMRDLERLVERVRRSRQATHDEVSGAEFYRVEAEIWLLEAQARGRGREEPRR